MLEYDIECECSTVIPIDILLVYKSQYYLHVSLDDCAYEIAEKQMVNYLGGNPFETDEN